MCALRIDGGLRRERDLRSYCANGFDSEIWFSIKRESSEQIVRRHANVGRTSNHRIADTRIKTNIILPGSISRAVNTRKRFVLFVVRKKISRSKFEIDDDTLTTWYIHTYIRIKIEFFVTNVKKLQLLCHDDFNFLILKTE